MCLGGRYFYQNRRRSDSIVCCSCNAVACRDLKSGRGQQRSVYTKKRSATLSRAARPPVGLRQFYLYGKRSRTIKRCCSIHSERIHVVAVYVLRTERLKTSTTQAYRIIEAGHRLMWESAWLSCFLEIYRLMEKFYTAYEQYRRRQIKKMQIQNPGRKATRSGEVSLPTKTIVWWSCPVGFCFCP